MSGLDAGIGKFVAALTGARPAARRNAEKDAWESGKSQAEARIKADEFAQRESLGDALTKLGVQNGDALGTVMRGGFANFPQGTQGIGDLADMAIQRQVLDTIAGENPDVAKINQLLAARRTGGGPLSPQEASVVPLGEALVDRQRSGIAADMARAGASNAAAQANLSRAGMYGDQGDAAQALALLRGRTDPNRSRSAAMQKVEQDLIRQGASAKAISEVLAALNGGKEVNVREETNGPIPGIGVPLGSAASPQSEEIPPQARALLKEGVPQQFGNGQVWTLKGGKPERLK